MKYPIPILLIMAALLEINAQEHPDLSGQLEKLNAYNERLEHRIDVLEKTILPTLIVSVFVFRNM